MDEQITQEVNTGMEENTQKELDILRHFRRAKDILDVLESHKKEDRMYRDVRVLELRKILAEVLKMIVVPSASSPEVLIKKTLDAQPQYTIKSQEATDAK